MTQESLTEKLATHLLRPVDEATRQRARLHLLDWLGCVAGARESEVAALQKNYQEANNASNCAWLGNVLEMDDIHRSSILHPGPVIWPALVVGLDYRMEDVLNAAVRGYETTIAIGSTFDQHHYAFFHNTSTAGNFGAAAAVADLFGGEPEVLTSAMGLAGSVTGGLWQMRHESGMTKQWHTANVLTTGGSAGFYASHGATGPRFILEGPQGLYAATCKNPKPMTFPDQWRIHDVSFKPWGACRHAHPAIDAALELKAKLGHLDGEIQVETYADAITFCDRPDPETVLDAKFSLQHAVALVATRGVPQLVDFESEAISAMASDRSRVSVAENRDITARYPDHYGARVTCAGETVELVDTLGDPERPLSRDGVIAKARALIAWGGLAECEADRAIELALDGDDVRAIHAMLEDWLS
ncbi:2-methylcitrate dehydratase PrpD [Parasphingorhabdus marina DSM 22363]|uniref:2-methylcitrate dehydratase PrpD n=1 Tax=Parasphingorhabdus marina DSM 22363 TaxID=1123272 RepID=A0A1N6CMT3_9SPHN|nr:MmgE/PrpD family protein [Parasphingorhabdus marina]SIN59759.1 2-methylcitrate dehydratase PrpD [Parasphingorhabdus marina DSM 22363]